jgi:hypothetical protein
MKYIIHGLKDYFSVLGQASNYAGANLDAEVAKACGFEREAAEANETMGS